MVRLALGAAFLRAVRFSFFRSCRSSILVVSATCNLFRCKLFNVSGIPVDVSLMVTAIEDSEQGTVGGSQCIVVSDQWSVARGRWNGNREQDQRWPPLVHGLLRLSGGWLFLDRLMAFRGPAVTDRSTREANTDRVAAWKVLHALLFRGLCGCEAGAPYRV